MDENDQIAEWFQQRSSRHNEEYFLQFPIRDTDYIHRKKLTFLNFIQNILGTLITDGEELFPLCAYAEASKLYLPLEANETIS